MRHCVDLVGLVEPLDNQSEIYVIASALVFIKMIEFVRIAVSQINYNSWKGKKPKEKNLFFSSSNLKKVLSRSFRKQSSHSSRSPSVGICVRLNKDIVCYQCNGKLYIEKRMSELLFMWFQFF